MRVLSSSQALKLAAALEVVELRVPAVDADQDLIREPPGKWERFGGSEIPGLFTLDVDGVHVPVFVTGAVLDVLGATRRT